MCETRRPTGSGHEASTGHHAGSGHEAGETPGARSRFSRAPEAGIALTERDEALLCDVFLHRAMRRDQIEALRFSGPSRANRRLRQLFDHGYLSRAYPREAPYGGQAVYAITLAAAGLVATRLGLDPAAVQALTRKAPTPVYQAHALAVVDVYLALKRETDARPGVELLEWAPELLCRQEYEIRPKGGGKWRKEVFRPDGFFRIRDGATGEEEAVFVEVDMGHTSLRKYGEKLAGYRTFRESGLYREIFGIEGFGVLVVTTGARRAQNLKTALGTNPPIPIRFTTFDRLGTDGWWRDG